ncbi:hypothetical protein VTK73DRAFT_5264 [Phialemonium thermophilum]|uniref:Rhodopsin domain-containing protein n=1 Tax=Phialemonium thermophilum TaxID=223376 RepID=A0ABR3WP26_9PEZI
MATNFVAEAFSYLAIAIVFIFLRLCFQYKKGGGFKGMGLDDLFMVAALLFYVAETVAAYVIAVYFLGFANNNITPEDRANLKPDSREWRLRVYGSKGHVIGWFTYTGVMWCLKACWIIYYARLTEGVDGMLVRIRLGYALIGGTYLASICMILFKCWPLHRQWQIYPDPGNNCQPGFSKLQVSFVMVLNTLTDLYLMAIPLPVIYKSRLNTGRKVFLIVLFSGGFLTMAFGILRCVTLVGATEPSESGQWSVRETFVAVMVSNAPHVVPLVKIWVNKLRGYGTNSSKSNNTPGSYQLESTRKSRSKKFNHPLSIPNETAWHSDEAIMTIQDGKPVGENGSAITSESQPGSNDNSVNGETKTTIATKPHRGWSVDKDRSPNVRRDHIVVQTEWRGKRGGTAID